MKYYYSLFRFLNFRGILKANINLRKVMVWMNVTLLQSMADYSSER